LADRGFGEPATFRWYDFDGRAFREVRRIETDDESAPKRFCNYGVPAFPSLHGF
jgi:hypothetical protein